MNTTALPKIFQFEEHIRTQSIFALSSLFWKICGFSEITSPGKFCWKELFFNT